jgi:Protein of unknown function (DUF1236)
MRRIALSLVILLEAGSAGYAQNDSGALQGVYGPPQSAPGKLRGVYGPPQSAPAASLPSTITAPDYGTVERGPAVSLPGDGALGEELPDGVKPSPIPDRPGYGRAMVNDRPAIIDLRTNRIVQYSD